VSRGGGHPRRYIDTFFPDSAYRKLVVRPPPASVGYWAIRGVQPRRRPPLSGGGGGACGLFAVRRSDADPLAFGGGEQGLKSAPPARLAPSSRCDLAGAFHHQRHRLRRALRGHTHGVLPSPPQAYLRSPCASPCRTVAVGGAVHA